jgi:low temperature requirement protein LtrA
LSVIRIAPPRLRTRFDEGKRSATWLELFYDLAFVVAVAALVERMVGDISGPGVLSFLGYFSLLWWLWASHTYYADRYDTDDLVYRLIAACQMVAVVVLAASLTSGEAASTTAFAIGFAASRILLLVRYWRAYRHVEETRALVRGYLVGFGLAAVLWTASIFVPENVRLVLWAVALSVDLATPWVMRKEQAKVPLDVSHLPERFGLFTILVLGESIAAVVTGLAHSSWVAGPTLTAGLGIGIATAVWWMYFDNARGTVVRRDASVRRAWRPTVWIYTHFLLAAALAATGAALEVAVADAGHGPMPQSHRWLLIGSVAVVFASLALIQVASDMGEAGRTVTVARVAGIPFLVLIGFLSGVASGWIAFGVLGICVAELVSDISATATDEERVEGALIE